MIKKMPKLFQLFVVLITLSACTVTEKMTWATVGGSKADGNVILGIDVPPKMGISETEVIWDIQQANAEADTRCKNWGYAGAKAFNEQFPITKICHPQGMSPCWSKTYRIMYQCIDDPNKLPIVPVVPVPVPVPTPNPSPAPKNLL